MVPCLVQVHEHGDEGCLSVGGHQGDDLILNGLDAAADFVTQAGLNDLLNGLFGGLHAELLQFLFHISADLLTADLDKRCQMSQRDGLSAVLVGSNLCNNLGCNVAGGGEGMGLLDQGTGNDGAVLQHVIQIDQIAVVHMLCIVVSIMEMDDAGFVGIHNVLGHQDTAGDVLGNLTGHVVTLNSVDGGVLVGVLLLDLFVVALDQAEDPVIGGVGLAQQAAGIAVSNVLLGDLKGTVSHDGLFHQVLNLFHRAAAAQLLTGNLNTLCNALDLQRGHADRFFHTVIGLGDGILYFFNNELFFGSVTFNDFHLRSS